MKFPDESIYFTSVMNSYSEAQDVSQNEREIKTYIQNDHDIKYISEIT